MAEIMTPAWLGITTCGCVVAWSALDPESFDPASLSYVTIPVVAWIRVPPGVLTADLSAITWHEVVESPMLPVHVFGLEGWGKDASRLVVNDRTCRREVDDYPAMAIWYPPEPTQWGEPVSPTVVFNEWDQPWIEGS